MNGDLDAGSREHRLRVWEAASRCKIFFTKGSRVKLGRWSSWLNANRWYRGQKYPMLMILVYIGILRGWWASADEVPALNYRLAQLEDGAATDEMGSCEQLSSSPWRTARPVARQARACHRQQSAGRRALAAARPRHQPARRHHRQHRRLPMPLSRHWPPRLPTARNQ